MVKITFWRALGFRELWNISFGLVASFVLLFAIFNSSSFVPEGEILKYTLAFLGYGILGSYVFARADIRSKLSKISFIKSVPLFLAVFVPAFFFITFVLNAGGFLPETLFTALVGVPVYLQVINAFIFATVEVSFWQGYLDEKIGIMASVIFAGIMHMFIWAGDPFFNLIGASFLFLIFSTFHFFSKKWFGPYVALIMTIALHSAYNLVKYKMIFGV